MVTYVEVVLLYCIVYVYSLFNVASLEDGIQPDCD